MARLNAVLTRDEFWCPQAVAVIRLLMLTGCRAGEIVSLEWDWIRSKRIHLPDSKSGPRTVWLSSAARAVIAAMKGVDMVTIAKLLGHALVETTERYTHLSEQSVSDAADRVSGRIHAALAGRGAEQEEGADHAHR